MHDSVAGAYHELTKYSEESLRSAPGLDWSRQPPPFKQIVSQSRVSLRDYLPFTPTGEMEPAPSPEPQGVGLGAVSRLLFYTGGVTGLSMHGMHHLRAAPSAGALYPTEIYLAARDVSGLEPGLYNYQVPSHELVRLWEGDQLDLIRAACGDDARFEEAPLCLLFTVLFWRSAWRYQERGYRRVLLDTGHAVANLAAYAPHVELTAHPFLGFMDAEINGLFFFDEAVEAALACVPLIRERSACVPGALWRSGLGDGSGLEAAVIRGERDLSGSATVRLHGASGCAEKWLADDTDAIEPPVSNRSIPLVAPQGLQEVIPAAILKRRSARRYQEAFLPLDAFGQALGFAFGRDAKRRAMHLATRDAGLLRAHVVTFAVDGLDAGIYAVEGAGEALLPLSIGSFRSELHRLSLGQDIAARCAAVLVMTAPCDPALALYGERAYRYLHLEAGIAGERFQLAATSLGLAACGIGGFFDDEVAALLDVPAHDWVLYLVTLGNE